MHCNHNVSLQAALGPFLSFCPCGQYLYSFDLKLWSCVTVSTSYSFCCCIPLQMWVTCTSPADQVQQHDSEIIIHPESESRFAVHLGFLQIRHHYEIKFSIKDSLGEDLVADPLQNLNCKVLEVMPSEDGQYRCTLL